VVVSDMTRRRLVIIDSMLSHAENILNPSGAAASTYPSRGGQLFAIRGDTTLVLDAAGVSFVVLDKTGKVIRVESVPRASDVGWLASPAFSGQTIDDLGRLIYRINPKMIGFSQGAGNFVYADSAPIFAASFATRKVDTLGYIKVPLPPPQVNTTDMNGARRFTVFAKPFELIDDWAVLPNGTIAIIRWRDYHVDWIEPGGNRSSSPPTAWNWTRLTDEEKTRFIDSLKARNTRSDSIQSMSVRGGPIPVFFETMAVAPSEVPDYPPPFVARATRVDADGRIWVLERGKLAAPPAPLVYDVIDRNGQIVDRVQMPMNAAVVGFGPGGAVYLSIGPGNANLASSIPAVAGPMMPSMGPPPNPMKLAKAIITRP
jgi:hypothetical protein